jgi:3-isopropylmalate/(R)-2-methylmalate dehydratase large subunit
MGRTISDKIIDNHALGTQQSDVYSQVRVDVVLGHDATIALLIEEFERRKLRIWDKSRVILTNDHFSPPATVERADISNRFLRFARGLEIDNLFVDRGICHQILVEHPLCQPGALVVGADSHTVMGGGIGALATGMGSTDILFALATGTTWLRKPKTLKVVFTGALSSECDGRDIVLELLRRLGEGGAQYMSMEFHDHCAPKLQQDYRFAISNMSVEIGAKCGIFVPDEVTLGYCRARDGAEPASIVLPDADADYAETIEIDLGVLRPLVAKPWSPANVVPVTELEDIPFSVAFIGSCAGGRISDIQQAAEVLDGRHIHPNVRLVIIPASVQVFKDALSRGYVQTLTEAGAVFNQSSCGPCGGIDKGVLGADDVCMATSTRNFRGRMGHWNSRSYLASARTVAKAALRGRIAPDLYEHIHEAV